VALRRSRRCGLARRQARKLNRQPAPVRPGSDFTRTRAARLRTCRDTPEKNFEKVFDQPRHRPAQVAVFGDLHRHRITTRGAHGKHALTCEDIPLTVLTAAYDARVTTADKLIADLPADTETIPIPVIRRIINKHLGPWTDDQQHDAVRTGAIRPVAKPTRPPTGASYRKPRVGRGAVVDRDQAVLIIVAAVLAFAADVPVVGMIRALRASGVDPTVFVPTT
jgi:hypothetical protein